MVRVFKALIILTVLGGAGLTAYAYLADLTPAAEEMRQPVVLDAG
jgi:hypothetical protein